MPLSNEFFMNDFGLVKKIIGM